MRRGKQKEIDTRDRVYKLLMEFDDTSLPLVRRLFVLAGQKGISEGYFFNTDSAKLLQDAQIVVVRDESDEHEVGRFSDRHELTKAFLTNPPSWYEKGRSYRIELPAISEDTIDRLRELRSELLERLRGEGASAAKEFLQTGLAIGGTPEDKEVVIKDIARRLEGMRSTAKRNKRK